MLQWTSRLVSRRADAIVLVSEAMRPRLPRKTWPKATVVPTGINLERFHPMDKVACRKELGLAEDKRVVLFGGDPDRTDKRYELAVAAIELVKRQVFCELLVARKVSHDRMPVYINAADVVLLCSTHEGSPNIVKEALACNRPVVSTAVGDVRERLSKARGSHVVDHGTPEALADAVLTVFAHGPSWEDHRKAVLDLDEHTINDRIVGIYRQLKNS
jgi:glycosyltransferase involved in cell wall biosynthesis